MIELLKEEASEEEKIRQREEQYRRKVIDSFFEYGKLKNIPAQRKKEKICLEEIAKSFEFGRDYTEKEVNLIIADFNDDFCTIRRDMIGFGIFERQQSTYRLKNNTWHVPDAVLESQTNKSMERQTDLYEPVSIKETE